MNYEEIMRDVAARKFAPVYFLHGEEPFFIDEIEKAIDRHALTEAEKGFNQMIVYGKDADPTALADALRRYPMMSERQVVILREAQDMKKIDELAAYVEQPTPSTVLVVCHKHKKYDMRTRMGKALQRHALVFESKKLYDNQIPDWIASRCRLLEAAIDPPAAALMAEYLGADLSKVANEIDKMLLNLGPQRRIDAEAVRQNIGISKDYNVFELQKAFAMRDAAKVWRIWEYFASNIRKNPLIPTLSSLYAFFSKVYMLQFARNKPDAEMVQLLELRSEWFLKDYKMALGRYNLEQTVQVIGLLHAYDLRVKGVGNDAAGVGSEEELMKELFWQILHA